MAPPRPLKGKMTANPVRAPRYRPGKAGAPEPEESSSSSESEDEEKAKEPAYKLVPIPAPLPKATSFPSALRNKQKKTAEDLKKLEEEFETESEEEGSGSGSSGSGSEESSSEEEESSSEEETAPRKLLRPVFLKKGQRNNASAVVASKSSTEQQSTEEAARKEAEARALIQEQLELAASEKKQKKDWDEEDNLDVINENEIDDTDDKDPEAEYLSWKLRELKRIRRARLAIEAMEAERAEIERRRNLTAEQRKAEDDEYIARQKEERGEKGQMQFMQKYHHKGAFFQEDLKELGVDKRNLMGAKFVDQSSREALPEYMQIRDMTKLGKKGRTKYRDMRSEDTGRWGEFGDGRGGKGGKKEDWNIDERFRSDRDWDRERERGGFARRDDAGATGANAKPLGERKRVGDGDENGREGKRPRVDVAR